MIFFTCAHIQVVDGLISLFNGISTFMNYLMPKIAGWDKELHTPVEGRHWSTSYKDVIPRSPKALEPNSRMKFGVLLRKLL